MKSRPYRCIPEFPSSPIVKQFTEERGSAFVIHVAERDLRAALTYMNWAAVGSEGEVPITMRDVMAIAANGEPALTEDATLVVRKPRADFCTDLRKTAQQLKIQLAFNDCRLFVRTLGAHLEAPGSHSPITIAPAYAGTLYELLGEFQQGLCSIPHNVAVEHWLRDLMLDAFKATALMHLHELAHRDLTGMNIFFCRTHRGGYRVVVEASCGAPAIVTAAAPANGFRPMTLDASKLHEDHIAGSFWWASIEALLCVDVKEYDSRAVDVFALAISMLGALLGGVGHYGRRSPADQIVRYFTMIAEYDHELWGAAVDNLAATYPKTCCDLASRLAAISFSPFYAIFRGYCPDLICLLRKMLSPNPF